MAAKLSYQAWRGNEAVLGLQGREEQNQGWLLLIGSINAVWQGSRARGVLNWLECRITDIMLNDDWSFFAQFGPICPQKPVCRCVAITLRSRSVFDRD